MAIVDEKARRFKKWRRSNETRSVIGGNKAATDDARIAATIRAAAVYFVVVTGTVTDDATIRVAAVCFVVVLGTGTDDAAIAATIKAAAVFFAL